MLHLDIKMSENNSVFVLYFIELCPYIIPNVSNNVQTQRNLIVLFKVFKLVRLILSPIANFQGNTTKLLLLIIYYSYHQTTCFVFSLFLLRDL